VIDKKNLVWLSKVWGESLDILGPSIQEKARLLEFMD